MELLVFADTHGRPARMLQVLQQQAEAANACFFLGDGDNDAELAAQRFAPLPFYTVCGNCDYGSFAPREGLAPFGGQLIFFTHGHHYRVKHGLEGLAKKAKSLGADAALFGHTHIPFNQMVNGVRLFNPGSLVMPRGGDGPTYGHVTIADGKASFEHCPLRDLPL